MNRIVVVGQPGPQGRLCPLSFARSLSARLGVRHWPVVHELPGEVRDALQTHEQWIASEAAGRFSEALFRRADAVVWLHFSPMDYLRDWSARLADALRRPSDERDAASATGARAAWRDVRESLSMLMQAPAMYALLQHPALAHVAWHELRSPRQAEFWLMSQRRRSGLRGVDSAPAGLRTGDA
jgi:hypothetical protein